VNWKRIGGFSPVGKRPAVVELKAAPAAVEEFAFAGESFEEVEKTGVHAVNAIGGLEFHHAIGAADGTAAVFAQMVPVPPRCELLPFAFPALIDRHVTETFPEGPVDTPQFATTLPALHFMLVISQFAEGAQAERE